MSLASFQETLISSYADGPTLTAAATASCLPTQRANYTFPPHFFVPGKALRLTAMGRISCVVTTPGTARYDIQIGGTLCFDTLAMPLNIVAKTNVMWQLEVLLVCRAEGSGTGTTLMGHGKWLSEASINTALPATGPGPGGQSVPYNTAPVVGGGFDNTSVSNAFAMRFTQTVATGSMTLHTLLLESLN
jgi:hypothetical protein